MKTKLFLIVILNLLLFNTYSQEIDSTKQYRLNFAIPDQPAFNLLTIQPSEILRPSSVKAVSGLFSNFSNGNSLTIPQNFGLEISPLLLANSLKPSSYYVNNNWIKTAESIRISIASETDASSQTSRNIALGLRMSFKNQDDINNDPKFRDLVSKHLRDRVAKIDSFRMEFCLKGGFTFSQLTSAQEKMMNTYVEEKLKEDTKSQILDYKEKYKNEHWNAATRDLAFAIKFNSKDSLASNATFSKFSFWFTESNPIFDKSGQFLFGVNLNFISKDTLLAGDSIKTFKDYVEFSLPLRLYLGNNDYKGFLDMQYKYIEASGSNNVWFNLGTEISLRDGMWFVFSAGIRKDFTNNTSSFANNFSLRFTLPENLK